MEEEVVTTNIFLTILVWCQLKNKLCILGPENLKCAGKYGCQVRAVQLETSA